jgi:hypothetical protein
MNDLASNLADSDPTKIASRLMQKAHNRDGLPEICAGLFLLVVAALIYAPRMFPPRSMAFTLVTVAFALLTPLMCIGLPWAVKWLRKRFLLARTGYVKARPLPLRPRFLVILIAILTAAVASCLGARAHWEHSHWTLAAGATLWGILTVLFGRSLRFVVSAVLAVAAGIWLAQSDLELGLAFAILWGGLGLISLISGTVVLLRFLRQPLESEEGVNEEGAGE